MWKVFENPPNCHHTKTMLWHLQQMSVRQYSCITWPNHCILSEAQMGEAEMQKFCLTWKDFNNVFNKEFTQVYFAAVPSHHNFLFSLSAAAVRRLLWCHLGLWGRSSTSTQAGSLCCERSFQANPEKEQPRAPVDLFVRNSDCRCSLHPWVHLQWRNRGQFHSSALT